MLQFRVDSLKCCRCLTSSFDEKSHLELLSDFDLSFVISYGDFLSSNFSILDKNAAVIDCSKGIDEVFKRFDSSVRNHVRRFDSLSGLSLHTNVTEKEPFYRFYTLAENSRDWFPVPEEELFSSIIFYVAYNGEPISGMSAYVQNEYIRIGRIFSTRKLSELENKNLIFGVSAKKLVFELSRFACENGYSQLDLGGVDFNSDQKSGITEFKLSFTDKVVPVKVGRWCKYDYKSIQTSLLKRGIDLT